MKRDSIELTELDRETMDAVIAGKRDREIAELLGRSQKTIVRRVSEVCDKLGARTRAQAAAIYCLMNTTNEVKR